VITMTEDDFLKRWSRRKREVAEAEQPAPAKAETREQAPLPEHPVSGEPGKKAEGEFDPASLPPIESITAVSDITAFLRAGVPAELTRAALRRVWTTDPAIRDFVGLAENAWDFTDPNAMPGFGPLESTDEVRRMIAQIVDSIGQAARPEVAEVRAPGMEVPENSNASNVVGAAGHEDAALNDVGSEGDHTAEGAAENLDNQVLLHSNKDDDAVQRDVTEDVKKTKQLSHRIHGAALPR
jgi:hypothetical protein